MLSWWGVIRRSLSPSAGHGRVYGTVVQLEGRVVVVVVVVVSLSLIRIVNSRWYGVSYEPLERSRYSFCAFGPIYILPTYAGYCICSVFYLLFVCLFLVERERFIVLGTYTREISSLAWDWVGGGLYNSTWCLLLTRWDS
ncbi:hypothetical protein F4802DRAFT_572201 [Xylaria palmicola]|nr:hypothetical protein F4802DRAFT_572201 [Xylaria palmicola]